MFEIENIRWVAMSLLAFCSVVSVSLADEDPDSRYELGPESQRIEDVPQGKVTRHVWQSQIFPDTTREYYVYVPAQYDGTQPVCLMVFQDGHAYVDESGQMRTTIVLDNLIHKGDLPVMIGVFINPGHHGEEQPENRWRASNRSFEYDTLADDYARFVIEELVPHIQEEHKLNLSVDPDDRAICGMSSGGICAFTAAWTHPEWFSKVLSHIGSFTNIRGGHVYPAMIRKTPNKPIRVFLQDGENDLDNAHGNWWLSNLQMEAALSYKDYDYKFVPGEGAHSGKHGGAILPDSLRWLWRDHVAGVNSESSASDNGETQEMIDPKTVFAEKSVTYSGGEYKNEVFKYRLMSPATVEEGIKYPLVLFLHGAGERGTDNELQLKYFPEQMAQSPWRERFPCYILAPQCRVDRRWVEVDWSKPETHTMPEEPGDQMKVVMSLLEKTIDEESVDLNRIYITGLSMGGYGTWDLAIRRKELFAAAAPVCGGADNSRAGEVADLPLWVVHGDADKAVPVERSRLALAAVREAGGQPVYVELPGVGHNSWTPGYADNDGLVPWLFRQTKE